MTPHLHRIVVQMTRHGPRTGTHQCTLEYLTHSMRLLTTTNNTNKKNNFNSRDWIPPNRPLPGDKSLPFKDDDDDNNNKTSNEWIPPDYLTHDANSDLDDYLQQTNQKVVGKEEESMEGTDWLSTRKEGRNRRPRVTHMVTPNEATAAAQQLTEIPIRIGRLLTSDEIISCLTQLGGINVQLITPKKNLKEYLGWKGLILCTGTSPSHIRILSQTIVSHLQKRNLAKYGVIGAMYGREGGEKKRRIKKNRIGRSDAISSNGDDGWVTVDCRNYILHVQDEVTRKAIDLEGLWSGEAGEVLRRVDCADEEIVDDYVAENPIPEEYMDSLIHYSRNYWSEGRMRGGLGFLSDHQKKKGGGRWDAPSNQKRRGKKKRRRRL